MFDCEMANHIADVMGSHGVDLRYGHLADRIDENNGTKTITFTNGKMLSADHILVAIGRQPKLSGLGLENTDVRVHNGFVEVDEF